MRYLVLLAALVACVAGVSLAATNPQLDGRIVGGTLTTIQNHPFQVSLRFSNSHHCGGSIISSNWIVTAAHCFERGIVTSSYAVRAGSTSHNTGGTLHSVTRIVRHELYDAITFNYNIAVVQVSPAFTFSTTVLPITLEAGPVAVGSNVVVTGWGATANGGSMSTSLRQVTVQIISDAVCNTAYAAFGGITPNKICASSPGRDACQGDDGGPLVGSNRLVGVVSRGVGCANPQFPRVYTRVSNVRTWIILNAV